jgi:hypothetical protein
MGMPARFVAALDCEVNIQGRIVESFVRCYRQYYPFSDTR